MSVEIDGLADLIFAAEFAIWAAGAAFLLMAVLLLWLLVRPARRVEPPRRTEAVDAEEMRDLVERMERRLAVLERAVADEAKPNGKGRIETGAGRQ